MISDFTVPWSFIWCGTRSAITTLPSRLISLSETSQNSGQTSKSSCYASYMNIFYLCSWRTTISRTFSTLSTCTQPFIVTRRWRANIRIRHLTRRRIHLQTMSRKKTLKKNFRYSFASMEFVTDLDWLSKMTIFESILTTLKRKTFVHSWWGSGVNLRVLKPKQHKKI